MKEIQYLSDKIEEEIHDAKNYAKHAIAMKEMYPEVARDLYNLSLEEMKHMNILHDNVVKLIEEYRKENGEPPEDMMARYEYLHGRHIEQATKARVLQAMYKEG